MSQDIGDTSGVVGGSGVRFVLYFVKLTILTPGGGIWCSATSRRPAKCSNYAGADPLRGGYPAGPVNFDAVPLPLELDAAVELDAEAPLGVAEGELRVRWRVGAPLEGAPTLEQYLAERVGLLVDPPLGATD